MKIDVESRSSAFPTNTTPIHHLSLIFPPQTLSYCWPSITMVWRESLKIFSEHSLGVLFLSTLGFSFATQIGIVASALIGGNELRSNHIIGSGPFATYSGVFQLIISADITLLVLLLAQAILGWLFMSFAMGALSNLVLAALSREQGVVHACVVATRRLPALLINTLLSSAAITVALIPTHEWLRNRGIELIDVEMSTTRTSSVFRTIGLRTLNAIFPDPTAPFADFVPFLSVRTSKQFQPGLRAHDRTAAEYYLQTIMPREQAKDSSANIMVKIRQSAPIGLVASAIITQVFLRFASAATMAARRQLLWSGVRQSSRLAIRHFVVIASHSFILNLTILGLRLTLLILPITIWQKVFWPYINQLSFIARSLDPLPWLLVFTVFIEGIFKTFDAIYSAKLFAILDGSKIPS